MSRETLKDLYSNNQAQGLDIILGLSEVNMLMHMVRAKYKLMFFLLSYILASSRIK